MAYSQFLQYKAFKFQINIGPDAKEGEILVCHCVLKALDKWLTQDGHERILPSVDLLSKDLLNVRNEIANMYDQGKLTEFWQLKIIKSVSDLKVATRQAYSYAYTAGEEYADGNRLAASENIHSCHEQIKKAIINILLPN